MNWFIFIPLCKQLCLGGGHRTGLHSEGMTVGELKQHVEDWMNLKFQVTLKYDPLEPLKQLENLGLLVTKQRGT